MHHKNIKNKNIAYKETHDIFIVTLWRIILRLKYNLKSDQGSCTGKTQRDGMGREVGGGFRMGNTCKSMADSCQCMAKTTTIW